MAGKRQHYLPKFLQAGFASRKSGDRVFTWVHRKDSLPFEGNTRHIGVEQDFYARGEDRTVDETITDAETEEFVRTVNEARLASPGNMVAGGFPRLLAHFEVRSRHLRQNFREVSEQLWSEILSTLDRPGEFLGLIQKHVEQNPQSLVQTARTTLREKGLSEDEAESLAARVKQNLPAAMEELTPDVTRALANLRAFLPQALAHASKTGHINALAKSIAPDPRVAGYQRLNFSIVTVPTEGLILGDCGVIFQVSGSKAFKSFSEKGDDIIAAILPITENRAVVGSRGQYDFDPIAVRRAIARCSHEFFIAHQRSTVNDVLAKEIGLDSAPLTQYEVASIAQMALGREEEPLT
jgi:hypothetical protein